MTPDSSSAAYADYYSRIEGASPWADRYSWVLDTTGPGIAGARVLDVGAGDGDLLAQAKSRGASNVVGLDVSSSGAHSAVERGVSVVLNDATVAWMPFRDSSFDVVFALETLEHVTNPYRYLREIRRVLTPRGSLICSVPNPRTGHPMIYPGLFAYPRFREFLGASGFDVSSVTPWQWTERSALLPERWRSKKLANSRFVVGGGRRVVEHLWRRSGGFPYPFYAIWLFECRPSEPDRDIIREQADVTAPGHTQ